jgi:AcrR family transcriptional regulator
MVSDGPGTAYGTKGRNVKSASRKYRSGHARYEAILAAARVLFDERGFDQTTIGDIGAGAGISGPGVYRHFACKADILTALAERSLERHRAVVDAALALDDREERIAYAAEQAIRVSFEVRYAMESYRSVLRSGAEPASLAPDRELVKMWARFVGAINPHLTNAECRALVLVLGGTIRGAMSASDRLREERIVELTVPVVRALMAVPAEDDR